MSSIRVNGAGDSAPPPHRQGSHEDHGGSPVSARETLALSDLLTSIRRHAILIGIVTVLSGALAGWLAFRETQTYRSTAVLRLTDARRSMTRGLDEGPPPDRPQRNVNALQSQAELLKGRGLVGSVIDAEGLRLGPSSRGFSAALLSQVSVEPAVIADTFFLAFSGKGVTVRNGTREVTVPYNVPYRAVGVSFAVTSKPTVERATLVLWPREITIDRFLKNLRISPRDETDIVDVSWADEVPEIARRVVNRLITTFQDVDVRQAQGQSQHRRLFLEEQLREVNTQLAASEAALAAFRSREQVFSSRDKLQAQQTALLALDMRRGELDADRGVYESLLTKLQDTRSPRIDEELRALISAPDIGANPVVAQAYQQLAQYQTARDSLTTGRWASAPNNPDVTRLDQLIAGSEQRLIGAVRGHLTTIDARREALATLRTRTANALGALPGAESAEERLSRQVESNRSLADRLKVDYQNARMAEAVEAGQVEIVDPASLPYRPVARLRALRVLLAVLVGFGAACAVALFSDSRKGHIRGRPDLEEEMRLPVLSVIPRIPAEGRNRASVFGLAAFQRAREAGTAATLGTNGHGPATSGMSPAGAEAFRLLRSSLKWTQRDARVKTLAISSALPDEGKTTTSANLAAVCAFEGKRVLLIDCDLRRPRLHKVFRLPRQPGITHVLRAGLSPAAVVRDTFIDGVSLLSAGTYAERFADLLGSDRMRSLVNELAEHFEMIILDTPPVLAVADTAALAPLVDGVLLVVGAGTTNRHAVEEALQQLEGVGAHVVGAVLNDARGELERYGGYTQHYSYRDDYASHEIA